MHQFSFKIPAPFDENYVRKRRRARSATSHDESDAGIPGLTFDANLLRFLARFICAFILGFYIMYVYLFSAAFRFLHSQMIVRLDQNYFLLVAVNPISGSIPDQSLDSNFAKEGYFTSDAKVPAQN